MVSFNVVVTFSRSLGWWKSTSIVGSLGDGERAVRYEAARKALDPTHERRVSHVPDRLTRTDHPETPLHPPLISVAPRKPFIHQSTGRLTSGLRLRLPLPVFVSVGPAT